MDDKIQLIANSFGTEKIKFNEDISGHTSIKLGGVAKLFAVVMTEREFVKIINECVQLRVPYIVIGTGSKIIISDIGFNGAVIKNRTKLIRITSIKGKVSKPGSRGAGIGVESCLLDIESGVTIGNFVEFLQKQGLEFSEFAGLSGSIGGNIFINKSLQSKCESIKVLNSDANIEIIDIRSLNLREHVVLSVVLRIKAK